MCFMVPLVCNDAQRSLYTNHIASSLRPKSSPLVSLNHRTMSLYSTSEKRSGKLPFVNELVLFLLLSYKSMTGEEAGNSCSVLKILHLSCRILPINNLNTFDFIQINQFFVKHLKTKMRAMVKKNCEAIVKNSDWKMETEENKRKPGRITKISNFKNRFGKSRLKLNNIKPTLKAKTEKTVETNSKTGRYVRMHYNYCKICSDPWWARDLIQDTKQTQETAARNRINTKTKSHQVRGQNSSQMWGSKMTKWGAGDVGEKAEQRRGWQERVTGRERKTKQLKRRHKRYDQIPDQD